MFQSNASCMLSTYFSLGDPKWFWFEGEGGKCMVGLQCGSGPRCWRALSAHGPRMVLDEHIDDDIENTLRACFAHGQQAGANISEQFVRTKHVGNQKKRPTSHYYVSVVVHHACSPKTWAELGLAYSQR